MSTWISIHFHLADIITSHHKKWLGDISFFLSLHLRLLDFEPLIVNKKSSALWLSYPGGVHYFIIDKIFTNSAQQKNRKSYLYLLILRVSGLCRPALIEDCRVHRVNLFHCTTYKVTHPPRHSPQPSSFISWHTQRQIMII